MQQVTVNDVRNAVEAALAAEMPDIPISDTETNAGLESPYFYVRLLEPVYTQELGRRYRCEFPFDVRYYSQEQGDDQRYDIAEQAMAALRRIEVGGAQCPGNAIKFGIIDEVLHVYVTYSMLLWEQLPQETKMQSLVQEEGVET
ncbi:DUF6838 family protein [Paenibacillus sp. HB172176]|uniref:phage tail terminator family protein n=1 Tax=Paenibacillus sp. HB172176 TaxID=2493690 RepID=UPI001F0DB33A|nr:hypothetical protein [Paenibacillus sp. HB172176]